MVTDKFAQSVYFITLFCPLQDKIQHDVNKRKNNTSQNFVWFYWQILFNIHKNMTVWHI